ncbi:MULTISPECIES: adenylate/guanylate cyclase domain-containing protein [unclassified Bradyrhizobium]|uniref:adenylate/guanylate cyclase domain-containing protein n=1 Tax=unclassified Bradyrhizobium TaxID=2631580 RepID=UPI00201146C9|nr:MULTISPECIES: adenylate/guanylate cyclase domain-containing protein [unclassified Bradyrhizobium]
MASERLERRLAAVVAADVADYGRLMRVDDARTLTDLKSARRTLINPAVTAHRGRIVKTVGGEMLVEFASAVDAAQCAIEVQRGMATQNAAVPQDKRIEFRIGIHLGDLMIDESDIFGDGVNIAARLEKLAEPGGICISDDAHRQIRGKVGANFDDLGAQTLKNITEPMRAWRIRIGGETPSVAALSNNPVPSSPPPALPDMPSIVVLPFQNMSGDPEQEYFADGMVEEIITALSRFKSLFVIARNSSFTYKGKSVDIKHVGRELGVRYVLEGSVRRAGDRVRISGQLIEAATGTHIWADRFDGGLEDVFGLQDQVTTSVVGLIAPRLEQAEFERARHKPTEKLDSYDHYLRGAALLHHRSSLVDAYGFFRKAIELDPEYAAAHAMVAWTWMARQAVDGLPLAAEDRAEAIRHARLAARLSEEDAFVLSRAGHVLTYLGHEYDYGVSLVEQAVALNPNLAIVWYSRGWVSLMCDETERAIESFDRMIRLSPLDPLRISAWDGAAHALFSLERYEEGCVAAMKAMQFNVNAHTLGALIINAVRAGRIEEAQKAVSRLLKIQPGFRTSHVAEAYPVRRAKRQDEISAALRDAGLPD